MKTKNQSVVDWNCIDREIGREAVLELVLNQGKPRRKRVRTVWEVIAFILALALIYLALGCKSTLAPEGPYHGDKFLFDADKVLVDSKDDLSGFLKWEMTNRKQLQEKKLQSITAAADAIRTNAPLWFKVTFDARNNYSNAMALHQSNVIQASNLLEQAVTTLQTQTLSTRALTNSVNLK